MKIALYILAGWQVLNVFLTIGYIGKSRKPITPGQAVVMVMISAGVATVLILAAGQLR